MKLLVSVRSVAEAVDAAVAGADLIDLKEPNAGALGALPLGAIRDVVAVLRAGHARCAISATVGDDWLGDASSGGLPAGALQAVLERVAATADCGVDYVKVGIGRGAGVRLDALARSRAVVVPVFIADDGLDLASVAQACALGFPAVMLDTADKRRGSLFDALALDLLHGFVAQVRRGGRLSGLAGALRAEHVPALSALAPDFAGFRSAVCDGPRTGVLVAARVRALRAALGEPPAPRPAP